MTPAQSATMRLPRHRSTAFATSWTLLPHDDPPDWYLDGGTTPGEQCDALAESTGERCPKDSVIVLVAEVLNGHGRQTDPMRAELCGGHFGVHRRGKPVRMATATPGYVV